MAGVDPASVDPAVFDRARHPVISCWFKESAAHLLDDVAGYLALLDRYGVGRVRLRSQDPGPILYEDDDQVVTAPAP